MGRALYEPGLGYYATSRQRPTREGDFLSAPELHPIFGQAVARQVEEMWQRLDQPADFTIREYGAGRGTLGDALREHFGYETVEAGDPVPSTRIVGVVLANEVLDAMPVHQVVILDGRLHEIYVSWSGNRFVELIGELSDSRLDVWFAERRIQLTEGQRAAVSIKMLDWLAEVSANLERGYVLIFDYGAVAAELYAAARHSGTVRAFRSHHVSSDVLSGVGHQDLTAHIDLDALADGAKAAGLDVIGRTTQAEFLVGCGFDELLEAERARAGEDWQAHLLLRSSAARLLDPRQLGGYAVVVFGRGVDVYPPLRGLSFTLRRP